MKIQLKDTNGFRQSLVSVPVLVSLEIPQNAQEWSIHVKLKQKKTKQSCNFFVLY